jgi:hypothetical protein
MSLRRGICRSYIGRQGSATGEGGMQGNLRPCRRGAVALLCNMNPSTKTIISKNRRIYVFAVPL